jgi:hypothetical protein
MCEILRLLGPHDRPAVQHLSTMLPRLRSYVQDPVGVADDVQLVLHHSREVEFTRIRLPCQGLPRGAMTMGLVSPGSYLADLTFRAVRFVVGRPAPDELRPQSDDRRASAPPTGTPPQRAPKRALRRLLRHPMRRAAIAQRGSRALASPRLDRPRARAVLDRHRSKFQPRGCRYTGALPPDVSR